ncbi:UDP-N-acetylmuramate--L-alanine ligase [bacterium]|nr:UDP-N-acetylmuramate--L-alanine ligase [bacterium]
MNTHKQHFHFVGIGGIGMSAIAKIMLAQGYTVSGCDISHSSKDIDELKKKQVSISLGHGSDICFDQTITHYVYSSDVNKNNPEFIHAQQKQIPIIHRSLALKILLENKTSIGISGSHGKTTTTGMIAHIFMHAHKDPSIVIGGHLPTIQNNARIGASQYFIFESDESDRSFLNTQPTLSALTNIDKEHMGTYKDIDDLQESCMQFINSSTHSFVWAEDHHIPNLLPHINVPYTTFGTTQNAHYQAQNITLHPAHSTFTVLDNKKSVPLGTITLNVPGMHNVYNALAAISVTLHNLIDFETIAQALETFISVDRRFTFKGKTKSSALVFDDYGHHPTEIMHTINTAKTMAGPHKVFVAFQPQRYTRTYHLWKEFIDVLQRQTADCFILTDIYSASEPAIPNISSKHLLKALSTQKQILYLPDTNKYEQIENYLIEHAQAGDIIVLLGAGKINSIAQNLIS